MAHLTDRDTNCCAISLTPPLYDTQPYIYQQSIRNKGNIADIAFSTLLLSITCDRASLSQLSQFYHSASLLQFRFPEQETSNSNCTKLIFRLIFYVDWVSYVWSMHL